MVTCPLCTKVQLVYVQAPTTTSCFYCGARWIQRGDEQDGVIGMGSPTSALRSPGQFHPTTEETR